MANSPLNLSPFSEPSYPTIEIPRRPPVKLRKIRALLYEKGISQKEVARITGRRPSTVRVVLSGRGTSRPIQETVAELLNIPYEELWPNSKQRAA
jgi:lambda repressor-like predicted transcriptional regulator